MKKNRIIVAPDSFKGSCGTIEVAEAIEQGIKAILPDYLVSKIPIADGGEGTVTALLAGAGGTQFEAMVTGPNGQKVLATYGILPDRTGVVELAAASGLPLIPPEQRKPLEASSYGTGELIRCCLDHGCRRILLGLGGSATTDGGMGLATALGFAFLDEAGQALSPGGGSLEEIATIEDAAVDARLQQTEFIIACDVTNPLCGPSGAAAIYGPQKGATAEQVQLLDHALGKLLACVEQKTGKSLAAMPGLGAAGGAALPLVAWFHARMQAGVEVVLDATGFDSLAADCCLVITGEGRMDGQSAYGKVPVGVARRAKSFGLPVVAIVGGKGEGAEAVYPLGVDAIIPCPDGPMELKTAMEQAPRLIRQAAELAARLICVGRDLHRPAVTENGREPCSTIQ